MAPAARQEKFTIWAKVIAIVGPTAVGKTATAIELVKQIGGEIVSADSMAVYKGMDIGTAKPTREERKLARFHLIDVVDPTESFSVGQYQTLAHTVIDDTIERNPPAIIAGGSGLYVKAAIDGLALWIPPRNEELRRQLREQAEAQGKKSLHAKLAEVDPELARKIHPNNLKRVIRALEIYETTGIPPSVIFERDAERHPRYSNVPMFGLTMRREALYSRIEERVDAMIAAGLIDEVAELLKRGIDKNLPSMQGLGYKEVAGYLTGEYTLEEAIDLLKKNTRRFAKRQLTWFRADKRIKWIDVEDCSASDAATLIRQELENEQEPA
ncbi:MAG: tRNA (adenosine(37)-N6)-dimethylallyltransferase MiaA [Armatimonadota bacterium]